ncbi:MAG: 50S ribosomal protein L23 [Lentisphaerae bacterium GWF2_52_8]|nr:MAG: 50S ribosomal protein L23 [Lentisphaerae bacterium GWF2_52_8]
MKTPYQIIDNILVTEKNTVLREQKKYVFRVYADSSKIEIAHAIEKLFSVKVKNVNIMNYSGKVKRSGRSPRPGRRPDWKKAVVTLSEGSIDLA